MVENISTTMDLEELKKQITIDKNQVMKNAQR